ncbi:hypothetical protein BSY17_3997 (plasmid) [Sphingobium sp. RAC03]|nr:hypothetical protein BSY17_3997 [Sphingobium sp. RAC03]
MRRNAVLHVRGKLEKCAQRSVPSNEIAVWTEDAYSLWDVVERCLKQHRLLGQFLGTLAGVLGLYLRDVSVETDNASIARSALVDLDPSTVGQSMHMPTDSDSMLARSFRDPPVRSNHHAQSCAILDDHMGYLGKAHANVNSLGDTRPKT